MYRGWAARWGPDPGTQEGVSLISLCSSAHRPIATGSSARLECSRSVMAARAVDEFGFAGMKNTLHERLALDT
jgi:hypothetical protein